MTTVKTITSCAKTVTSCPANSSTHTYIITDTISSYTTVCPVTATYTPVKPTSTLGYPALVTSSASKSVGTVTPVKPTTSIVPFTGGAGRVAVGVEMVAAAAGIVAALL